MKTKAEKLVAELQKFVKELEEKQQIGPVHKTRQLEVIQNAMKNLKQDSITIPDEMISLESRLMQELEQETNVVNEIYDYLKEEVTGIFQVEKIKPEPRKETVQERIQENIQENEKESVQEKVEEPIQEKNEEKIQEEPKKKIIKKVIINDDSQVSLRPSFRLRHR